MKRALVSLAVMAALSGCSTINDSLGNSSYTAKIESAIDGVFSSRIERLEALVAEGKDTEAQAYLERHGAAFDKADVRDRADGARATLLWRQFRVLAEDGRDEAARKAVDSNTRAAARFTAAQNAAVGQVDRRLALARLKSLVAAGQDRQALEFLRSTPRGLDGTDPEALRIAAEAGNRWARALESDAANHAARLAALDDKAAEAPARWPTVEAALTRAKSLDGEVALLAAVGVAPPPAAVDLRARAATATSLLQALAQVAFEATALDQTVDFERSYPVHTGQGHAAAGFERLEPRLAKAQASAVERFARVHGKQLQPGQLNALARVYTSRLLTESGKSGPVAELLVSERVRAAGLPAPDWAERATLIAVEAPALRDGRVGLVGAPARWPVVHLGQEPDMKTLPQHPEIGLRDVALVLRIAGPRLTNESAGRQSIQSRALAGYREVPNQKRTQLANSLASAERSLASTSQTRNQLRGLDYSEMSRGSQNLAMFTNLVNEFTSSAAESDVASLRAQLSAEPMIVSEPVYRSYAYSVDARRVSKQTVVQWTLLDLKTGRSLAGQETLAEAKDFKVVAGVDANDENAGRILAGYSSVEDIQGFANQPVRIPLAEVWLKIRGDLASRW